MVYLRIALAEANTESAQLLLCLLHQFSNRMARSRCSRKFSSMTKNDCTFRALFHLLHDFEELVAGLKKLTNFPLPPKKAEVVQKLQPMGQPTDGMMVAAVAPCVRATACP